MIGFYIVYQCTSWAFITFNWCCIHIKHGSLRQSNWGWNRKSGHRQGCIETMKATDWCIDSLTFIDQALHMVFIGFPMVLPGKTWKNKRVDASSTSCIFSYGFPMVFPWFSYGFQWFSHGFPMVLSTPNLFSYRPLAIPAALPAWATHPLGGSGMICPSLENSLGMILNNNNWVHIYIHTSISVYIYIYITIYI